jgi:N-acylneuraminate cytidylyltransferase
MTDQLEILGLIPARGGSKGIPRKNVVNLAGKPLIAWTVEAALESKHVNRVVLSSDDPAIIEVASRYGAEAPFVRPSDLAADDTPALPVIQHAVSTLETGGYRPDIIVLLQPTSPLRTGAHIDEAVQRLAATDADSIVSVVPVPHNCNPYSVMRVEGGRLKPFLPYDEAKNLRQEKPVFYARNGAAIYAFTYRCLVEKNSIYGDEILPYVMTRDASFDIDDPLDLELCAYMLKRAGRAAGQERPKNDA